MSKMKTKTVRLKKPITDSQMVNALKNSMGPIFEHFEQEIAKDGEKLLWIEVTAGPGKVNLKYGFAAPQPKSANTEVSHES